MKYTLNPAMEGWRDLKIAVTEPASCKDPGKVRLGGESPSFGPVRK